MSQPSLRGRVVLKFPANVVAGFGIIIDKTNSTYTFSVDPSILGDGGGDTTPGGGIGEAPLDGQQYGRQNGAWTVITDSGGTPGTISNPLIIERGATAPIAIIGTVGGLNRWRVNLGDTVPESGVATGADFHIDSYNNDGSYRNLVLHANRETSEVTITAGPAPHNSILSLNKLADGQASALQGLRQGSLRWGVSLGDSVLEAGGNVGSNFRINSYNDAGGFINAPLFIERSTSKTMLTGGAVSGTPILAINKFVSGQTAAIQGQTNGVARWQLSLGDVVSEGGTSDGSDFRLNRYNNAGTLVDVPMWIKRSNGQVTLTGSHTTPSCTLAINKPAGSLTSAIQGQTGGVVRWQMALGDAVAEGGSNSGSDFRLQRYSDAGALIDVPLWIKRSNGVVTITGSPPDQAPILTINKTSGAGTQSSSIQGQTNTSTRWHLALGDGQAETGSNVGSDFRIHAHNDDGSFRAATTLINRANSALTHSGEALKTTGALWTDISDARIKTVVGTYDQGLAAVRALEPVRFTYNGTDVTHPNPSATKVPVEKGKPDPDSPHYQMALEGTEMIGLIAQAVEVPMPELVRQVAAKIDGEQVEDFRLLNATPLIYALVNAIKELAARVEALEAARR